MQECQNQFENLANRIEGLNEQFMISRFIASLTEKIWLGVQMFRPTSLSVATNQARLQEEKIWANRKIHQIESNKVALPKNFGNNRNPLLLVKKLSLAEMKERREKGLCSDCTEKYS